MRLEFGAHVRANKVRWVVQPSSGPPRNASHGSGGTRAQGLLSVLDRELDAGMAQTQSGPTRSPAQPLEGAEQV